MPTKIYLICGSTGAGKTFYSKKLSQKNQAFHFSVDEMMKTLFWIDAPGENQYQWVMERINRCEQLIMQYSAQLYLHNTSVILDLGFSTKDHRHKFYSWCMDNNFLYELHFLDIDRNIRWDRVQKRNSNLSHQSILVDEKTFLWMEDYFMAPDDDEMKNNHGIIIKS